MRHFTDDDIRWLADLLAQEGLEQIEVQEGDETVMVGARQAAARPLPPPPTPEPAALPKDVIPVISPMPGVFYRSSSPETPPYVEVGDVVERGDIVGLIEVMKMFNEVTAPVGGTVLRTIVPNSAQVEHDQALMLIQLAG
jgi:acetyl-CoA carboxylase biotin carboxyl carrier protein